MNILWLRAVVIKIYVVVERRITDMTVAELIKKTRLDANMTQEEYGLKFGVTRQTVSSWENGKSIPDLQMLIDICNTYQVSLDKLLNENEEIVNKIDLRVRIAQKLKYIVCIVILVIIILGLSIVNWSLNAVEMNEQFVVNATQAGFVIEDGIYIQEMDGVLYSLPNQRLSFLKRDFFAKYAYAQGEKDGVEIDITFLDYGTVLIELDNDIVIKGTVKADGDLEIEFDDLANEEMDLYNKCGMQVQEMVKCTKTFYDVVY